MMSYTLKCTVDDAVCTVPRVVYTLRSTEALMNAYRFLPSSVIVGPVQTEVGRAEGPA